MPFYSEAAKLFSLADKKKLKLSISALCLADAHYILLKQNPDLEVKNILRKFKVLVNVLPLDNKIADLALNSEFKDFEDAIQYYTAIEYDQDLIITRNQSDFKESKLPIMTAGEFIKSLKNCFPESLSCKL
jgi:mRNA-degrading endonuclease YafQ of YafQ-DinJ toxin-antitoxin module